MEEREKKEKRRVEEGKRRGDKNRVLECGRN